MKTEHWFSLPASPIFALLGFGVRLKQERLMHSWTIAQNPPVASIDGKAMPVRLHPEDYDRWLDGEADDACLLAAPFPSQLMAVA